jgi:hypothetical protein
MRIRFCFILLAVACCFDAQATSYNTNLSQAVTWLTGQQNSDGSWGANPNLQPVYTSVAVQALARAYNTNAAYYAGVTWLEDHNISNVDLTSRSAEALISHGDSLGASLTYLNSDQYNNSGTYGGWGLNSNYTSSTLDTALALIAIKDLGTDANQAAAVTYLQNQQGTTAGNQGWTINGNSNTSSDPSVTAIVIQALARYTGTYSVSGNITNGLTTLNSLLNSSSPSIQLALAAQAAQDAGDTVKATTFLNYLVASQSTTDGSWNEDPYITAVATRAIATNVQAASQSTIVPIADQNLQAAINKALGRNAMDSLTLGLLAQLTTLNAAGDNISNLSGLQNAVNLKTVNLNNNNLANISAISSLTGAAVTWYDNPGNPSNPPGTSVPAMPPLAMLILAVGLMGLMQYLGRAKLSGQAGQLCLLVLVMAVTATGNSYAQTATTTQAPIPTVTLQELRAKGIPSEQLQAIQKIGGNILQAKRTATAEPGDNDLLNQVQATVSQLLSLEKPGVSPSQRKSAQSSAYEVVTALRQESNLLQPTGNKSAQKQILSGGKQIGQQRGALYSGLASQLEAILGNNNAASRIKQLLAFNGQLQPVSSITQRLKHPDVTPNYHSSARIQ